MQKVFPKQVMSHELSCLEELVLACHAGKHSRVKELWRQMDSLTLVNRAINIELPKREPELPLTPVDALLIRLALSDLHDQDLRSRPFDQDLRLIHFLQEVGSRASVYGLQQFLSLCCMLLDDIIALVNRGLIINGIDLTAVNITGEWWTCRRYSSALECTLESYLLSAVRSVHTSGRCCCSLVRIRARE